MSSINVNKQNTKILQLPGGWIRVVYDTGQADADKKPISLSATLTQAAIEVSAGALLPKARVKALLDAALTTVAEAGSEKELAAL